MSALLLGGYALISRAIGLPKPIAAFRNMTPVLSFRDMMNVYRQKDALVPHGASVFLGDSHTMSLAEDAVTVPAINFGIGRQRSDHLLQTMDTYRSLGRAGRVFILIGTNDLLLKQGEGIADRYRAILARIPEHTPVVMSGVPRLRDDIEATKAASNAAQAACAERPNCRFIDLWTILDQASDYQPDGVHLSDAGYVKWIAAMRAASQ